MHNAPLAARKLKRVIAEVRALRTDRLQQHSKRQDHLCVANGLVKPVIELAALGSGMLLMPSSAVSLSHRSASKVFVPSSAKFSSLLRFSIAIKFLLAASWSHKALVSKRRTRPPPSLFAIPKRALLSVFALHRETATSKTFVISTTRKMTAALWGAA